MWDLSKSPSVNLANMGLLARPNQDIERANEAPKVNRQANVIELFDVPDSDNLQANKKVQPMPLDDQKYIAKCMTKHGDNYEAMFRDIKVNNMQHTESQLRKLGARFLLLEGDQRKVNVPEKVRELAL